MNAFGHTGYGLRDGALHFIADVPSGLACRCVCAGCGQALIAKKGPIRQPHFAHYADTDCRSAAESSLHLLAKDLLAELKTFELPQYTFLRVRNTKSGVPVRYEKVIAKGGQVSIDRTRIEQRENDFVPDILIESGPKALVVEIAVTHRVDRAKLRKLRRRNLPAIEIRLDLCDSFLPRQALQQKLQAASAAKVWLFHPGQREAERAFAKLYRRELGHARRRLAQRFSYPNVPSYEAAKERRVYKPPPWLEFNRLGEDFNRKNGRYPSVEELQTLWPQFTSKGEL